MSINYDKKSSTTETGLSPGQHTGPSAIDLQQVTATAPDLVLQYQSAKVSLDKHRLAGERAAVYLVIDHSRSMAGFFKDGTVQDLAERVLALAAHFDDDGVVPVIFFDTVAHPPVEVALGRHAGMIDQIKVGLGRMGQTDYAVAMRLVIDHYQRSGSTHPALVIFQTDGSPTSKREATDVLCQASELPLFWQFIGFGDNDFSYLRKLDDLAVPRCRRVDNAGFFAAGPTPATVSDTALYDNLVAEYPTWLASARSAGIIPR